MTNLLIASRNYLKIISKISKISHFIKVRKVSTDYFHAQGNMKYFIKQFEIY